MRLCRNVATDSYRTLKNWEKATRTAKERNSTLRRKMSTAGKDALIIAIIAKICVRQSGQSYKKFGRELSNSYADGDKEYPITLVKVNHRIEYFKPMKMRRLERSST